MQNYFQCPKCSSAIEAEHEQLLCSSCGSRFEVKEGISFLLDEDKIGWADRKLRDQFYDGILGKFYHRLMPLLSLPARPFSISKTDWLIFVTTWILLTFSFVSVFQGLFQSGMFSFQFYFGLLVLVFFGVFFIRHPHFFHLLWSAVPAKISLERKKYRYSKTFAEIHREVQDAFRSGKEKIRLLDVSTGTGNSLLRHGWTSLNAEIVGFDLSETMLRQLQESALRLGISVELVIGDATNLPFADDSFDVVTNYGALNGYTNIQRALSEMNRVMKPGGFGVFLDEQLYNKSTWIEKQYFSKVLSSHNLIHHCPSHLLPPNTEEVQVHQIYEFYYLCTFRKK
ncbi:MAG: hypothetical protein RLY35_651 [Bacteroidota bacterium]